MSIGECIVFAARIGAGHSDAQHERILATQRHDGAEHLLLRAAVTVVIHSGRRASRAKAFGSRPCQAAADTPFGRQNGSAYSATCTTSNPAEITALMISARVHCHSTAPWAGKVSFTWQRAK